MQICLSDQKKEKKKRKKWGVYLKGIYPLALYLSALVFCLKNEVFVVSLYRFTHTRLANNRQKCEISFFFFLTRKKWCLIIILKAETLLLKLIKVYFLKISSLSAEVTARPGDPKGDYRPLDFSVRGLSP